MKKRKSLILLIMVCLLSFSACSLRSYDVVPEEDNAGTVNEVGPLGGSLTLNILKDSNGNRYGVFKLKDNEYSVKSSQISEKMNMRLVYGLTQKKDLDKLIGGAKNNVGEANVTDVVMLVDEDDVKVAAIKYSKDGSDKTDFIFLQAVEGAVITHKATILKPRNVDEAKYYDNVIKEMIVALGYTPAVDSQI